MYFIIISNDHHLSYHAVTITCSIILCFSPLLIGHIDIRIITSVAADPLKKKDSKGYLFYITTPARVYNLAANTEKELSYWYFLRSSSYSPILPLPSLYSLCSTCFAGWTVLTTYYQTTKEQLAWNFDKFRLVSKHNIISIYFIRLGLDTHDKSLVCDLYFLHPSI